MITFPEHVTWPLGARMDSELVHTKDSILSEHYGLNESLLEGESPTKQALDDIKRLDDVIKLTGPVLRDQRCSTSFHF